MMTQRTLGGISVTVAGLILLAAAQPASAVDVPFPRPASAYATWLARAMDACPSGVVSVTNAGSPSTGCFQANTITDGNVAPGATMTWARLWVQRTVNHAGRVRVLGRGFHGGQRMKVYLKLRVTKLGQNTSTPPSANRSVTFEDVAVLCGNNPVSGCFQANVNGAVAAAMKLTDCMTQNSQPTGLATGNIQILDSGLVNCDTGLFIATPGIVN